MILRSFQSPSPATNTKNFSFPFSIATLPHRLLDFAFLDSLFNHPTNFRTQYFLIKFSPTFIYAITYT